MIGNTIEQKNMGEWKAICNKYASDNDLTVIYVNENGFGVENKSGEMFTLTPNDLYELLGGK